MNLWVVQSDAGCFPDGTIALGCVIKDPTNNIFLDASIEFQAMSILVRLRLLLSVGALNWPRIGDQEFHHLV